MAGKIYFKIGGKIHPMVWTAPDAYPDRLASMASQIHGYIGGKWNEQDPQNWHNVLKGFSDHIDYGGVHHHEEPVGRVDYNAYVDPDQNLVTVKDYAGNDRKKYKLYDDGSQLQRSELINAWGQLKKAAEEAIEILGG